MKLCLALDLMMLVFGVFLFLELFADIYEFEVLKCLWWLFRSSETAHLGSTLDQLHRSMLVICKCSSELMLIIMWFDKGECLTPCACFPDFILGHSDDIFPLLIDCYYPGRFNTLIRRVCTQM